MSLLQTSNCLQYIRSFQKTRHQRTGYSPKICWKNICIRYQIPGNMPYIVSMFVSSANLINLVWPGVKQFKFTKQYPLIWRLLTLHLQMQFQNSFRISPVKARHKQLQFIFFFLTLDKSTHHNYRHPQSPLSPQVSNFCQSVIWAPFF